MITVANRRDATNSVQQAQVEQEQHIFSYPFVECFLVLSDPLKHFFCFLWAKSESTSPFRVESRSPDIILYLLLRHVFCSHYKPTQNKSFIILIRFYH